MQNNQTPYLGLPLPSEANLLEEDLPRLQQALTMIDETLGTLEQNRISQGDSSVTVTDTGDGKVTFTLNGVEVAGVSEKYAVIPKGTTAERPVDVKLGAIRYNTDSGYFETFTVSGWGDIATPPTITTLAPLSFNGEQGTQFTINGAFFDKYSEVKFITASGLQLSAGSVTFVNASQLKATTPRDFTVAEEPLSIMVTNSAGLSATSAPLIDCGSVPAWNTEPGNILTTTKWNDPISVYVSAGETDGGSIAGYALKTGALPSGVTFNPNTGLISGSTGAQNTTTYTFTIEATDNAGNTSSRQFTIIVSNAPPAWSTAAGTLVTTSQWNSPISTTITATDPEGQAVSYSVISGSLPAGVTLNASTGAISGTVSGVPDAASKTVQFTAAATDAQGGQATRQFALQLVNAAPVWSAPAENATIEVDQNAAASITLAATDPEGQAVSFALSSGIILPAGLSLSANIISGTPTTPGTTNVSIDASDGFVKAARPFIIVVSETLFAFSSHTFTSAGQSGRYGPTATQVRNAYSGVTWAQNALYLDIPFNGYQLWTVPKTGIYRIRAAGGGQNQVGTTTYGAIVEEDFQLSKGEKIFICVGQRGIPNVSTSSNNTTASSGGTFVARGSDRATATPLLVAGGAGAATGQTRSSTVGGQLTTYGAQGNITVTSGGTDGNGGGRMGGNIILDESGSNGSIVSSSTYWHGGGGGGGFYTSGGSGNYGHGGLSFRDGLTGRRGTADSNGDIAGAGGFGGGAGSYSPNGEAGGGGGYSGGGPGNGSGSAGGGGSFSATGNFRWSASGPGSGNAGNGFVIVTLL